MDKYKPIPQKRVRQILKKLTLLKQRSDAYNRVDKDGKVVKSNQ